VAGNRSAANTSSQLRSRWRSWFGLTAFNVCCLLAGFSGLRLALFWRFKPESGVGGFDVFKTFLIGFHLDLFVALTLTLPLAVWLALIPGKWCGARWHGRLINFGLVVFWAALLFLLVAELYFFEEFKSRFNTVAVDYLFYPHEVFINIWDTYPVFWVGLGCLAGAAAIIAAARRPLRWSCEMAKPLRAQHGVAVTVLAIMLAFSLRPNETRFSRERVLNEIADNGELAFITAALTHNLDYGAFYGTMPREEAFRRARQLLAEPQSQFGSGPESLQRSVSGSRERARLNVVIFLEESFGSEFWGCLGATNSLTPEMDRVAAEEGMLFTNIYASGNRTVRGFEGVLASFPPLPGDSIVKRDRSANVETVARILKRDGYNTLFLYGGRGVFDGMRSFALNNGYDRFIEQAQFEHPTHKTIWGVCDEDAFQRALQEFRDLAATGKPFCGTILSVSNHKPYTYPPGRIPEDPAKRRRVHAVKYSDYALGQFFRQARKEPFYTNTIFVVVADHGARVYGSQSIPIHSYEVPFLIIGPAVVKAPSRVGHLGCSLDVAPTVLGLLGRPYETMFFGRDLLNSPPEGGRVLLNHNRDIGLYHDGHLVVLGINKQVEYYHGDPKATPMQRVSQPDANDLEARKDAVALFQMADELYMGEQYRVGTRERSP